MKKLLSILSIISCVLIVAACSGDDKATNNESTNGSDESDYPNNQISMIIPFDAGGASDMVSRTVSKEMEDELGTPVVNVNKPGATGTVGMSFVEASKPDGYTIGYVPVELSMIEAIGLAELTPNSFDLVGRAIVIPAAITVPVDAPYDSIEEFIDYAKEHPGEVQVGNSGTGSIWHIAAAGLAQETGMELSYVPFDGAAPAVTALLGGHIDAVSVSPSEVKSGVDGGDLKILAVMSEERDGIFEDVPTLKEEGIDLEIAAWGGFVVPKETPDNIKSTLEAALEKAVGSEAFLEISEERGLNASYLSSEDFANFANEQYEMYKELIPKLDLE